MCNDWIYVVLVLLYKLAECKPVEKVDETIHNLYKSIKNDSCSLDISPVVDDKKFDELCGDKSVHNVTNISDEQFLFDFTTFLCYSVYHNVRALCDSRHNQSTFTPQPFETEPSKFCSSVPAINITDKCNSWLEDPGDKGVGDCNIVSKVVEAVMRNTNDLCSKECVKANKLDPVCKSVVGTSLILASVAIDNNTVKEIEEESFPSPPREIIESVEKTDPNNKSDEISLDTIDSKMQAITDADEVAKDVKADKKETQDAGKSKTVVDDNVQEKVDTTVDNNSSPDVDEELKQEEAEAKIGKENMPTIKSTSSSTTTEVIKTEPHQTEATEDDEEQLPIPTASRNQESEEKPFQGSIGTGSDMVEESNFFSYFMLLSVVAIVAYLVFHNKQKVYYIEE